MDAIFFLQSFSSPLLTDIFKVITSIGHAQFYPMAIPILYWTWRKDAIKRLAFLLLPSLLISLLLKNLFQVERPIGVALTKVYSYSFPSGHALGATVAWGYLALAIRRRWFTILALVVIALIALSRMYLGVHTPSDIAGGIFFGGILLAIYWFLEPRVTPLIKKAPPLVILAMLFAITIPLAIYCRAVTAMGLLMGMGAGALFEDRLVRFIERSVFWKQLLKVLIGTAFTLLFLVIYDAFEDSPRLIRYLLLAFTGFFAFGITPLIFVVFRLSKRTNYPLPLDK